MVRSGTSLIGLLVAMAILLVLGVIMSNAINKATTGAGSTVQGTAASAQDLQYLFSLFQSMAVAAQTDGDGSFLVPSRLTRRHDTADDTTAGLFSAMIAQQFTVPKQLISGNERSPYVQQDEDYDYTAYNPAAGIWWDPRFTADLSADSNDSFAHVPLYGNRLKGAWRFTASSRTPVLGNRGPADGIADPRSWTYGRDGQWAGHVVFGDGHVEFLQTFIPTGLSFDNGGQQQPDNIFRMEQGADGSDVILSFTKAMTGDGPQLQFD
jgi:hypothetical protein